MQRDKIIIIQEIYDYDILGGMDFLIWNVRISDDIHSHQYDESWYFDHKSDAWEYARELQQKYPKLEVVTY